MILFNFTWVSSFPSYPIISIIFIGNSSIKYSDILVEHALSKPPSLALISLILSFLKELI